VAGDELYVRVYSVLTIDEAVSLRVDLSPVPGTALLNTTVRRVIADDRGAREGYVLRVREVSAVDAAGWERLLRYRSGETKLADIASPSGSFSQPGAKASGSLNGSAAGGDLADAARRRLGMRDALKAAPDNANRRAAEEGSVKKRTREQELIARPSPGASMPTAPATVPAPAAPHLRPVAPPPARAAAPPPAAPPRAAAPPEPPPRRAPAPTLGGGTAELRWSCMTAGGRTYLEVVWLHEAAFATAVRTQLAANVLSLPIEGGDPPRVPPITLVLRFGTTVLQTTATPVHLEPHRVSYRLSLDGAQFAELRRVATAAEASRPRPRGH
jgi:hypothetical protein